MPSEVFMLFSSSKGNCCLVKNGSEAFLIDAGVSARRIEHALCAVGTDPASLRGVFLTHEHSDHIAGINQLCKRYGLPVFAPPGCMEPLAALCPDAIPFLRPFAPGTVVNLERSRVYAVATPHDAAGSVGFRIDLSGELLGYFTDIGYLTTSILKALSGCHRVVIESNHDVGMLRSGPYPEPLKRRILGEYGHLSNATCASLLPHLPVYGTKRILLAHLSEQNNTPEIAYEESASRLRDALTNGTVTLSVAAPSSPTEL
ncbi:MAG: MBL fold metallo-hydrolase [Oscillospiraceae bacterium]|nr:MBL fold metallo-hydrolase [Oscillospiraceae bacterium]